MPNILERARAEGAPLIEGDRVTFVWEGERAPLLLGDFTDNVWSDSAIAMQQVEPGLWAYTTTLPRDAYVEYVFKDGDDVVNDPLNGRLITNGVGGWHNYFSMPDKQHTPLVRRERGVPAGTVTLHTIDESVLIASNRRKVWLYQPPVDEPCPLLVVLDGNDYYHRAKITTIVDNLIASGRIRPVALALPAHGGRARFVEYLCSDSTIVFLLRDVLPLAQKHLNLIDVDNNPGAYAVMGASMGGLMSLYAGLRFPDVFGSVASMSGAFGFQMMGRNSVIYDLLRLYEGRPVRIWMNVGRYEWLLNPNRDMRTLLDSKGYDVTYREYNGGHNYTSWRDEIPSALETLFGRSP